MARFLILDIGAGTMDILCYDTDSRLHYKAVAKSPVVSIAERVSSLPGNLLVLGSEMGGGPVAEVLKRRADTAAVVMSRSASATVHHDPERVVSWGIKVVDDATADGLRQDPAYSVVCVGDVDPERLMRIIGSLDVPFAFDAIGICAQDHGVPPPGTSHLDYRHSLFKGFLEKDPFPHSLLFQGQEDIPATFSRLAAISRSVRDLSAAEVYVMDSGIAAILGASMDSLARDKERILTLDLATSHTVGATLEGGEIAGFFEYHTRDVTLEKVEILMVDLADGNLEHERILQEGGHGAFIRKAFGWDAVEVILATGPQRSLVGKSRFPIALGSPLGDNMMTGAVGVLEAIRRRRGLDPFTYL
jgi:uncharacterized protein (DUF1786 family)